MSSQLDIEHDTARYRQNSSVSSSSRMQSTKVRLHRAVEVTVIVIVIVIVWALASVPAVVYYTNRYSSDGNIQVPKPGLSTVCTQAPYNGLCHTVLFEAQICIVNSSISSVYTVSSEVDQDLSHSIISQVPLLSPSPECEAVLVPFLCQYLFTLCDGDGKPYSPSSEECVNIRDKVCVDEWKTAERLLGASQLPDCESLPLQPICNELMKTSCVNETTTSVNETEVSTDGGEGPQQCPTGGGGSPMPANVSNTTTPLECEQDFIYNERVNQCRPHCPRWKNYSHQVSQFWDISLQFLGVLSVLVSICVIILSCWSYKQMLKFPTVFIVYQMASLLIGAVTVLISFTDRETLFCSSEDWIEVLFNNPATPFCKFSATVFFYVVWQICLWWVFHIVAVFCGVNFPFRMQSFQKSKHAKHVYTGLTLAGIVIPFLPVIVLLSLNNFTFASWQPATCFPGSIDTIFYTFIVPLTLLSAVCLTLMVVSMKNVAKGLSCFKAKRSKRSTAVAKLLVLFCYMIVLVMFNMATFSLIIYNVNGVPQDLLDYFKCESVGIYPGKEECVNNKEHGVTSISSYIGQVLMTLYPIPCLIFAINRADLKKKLTTLCKR